MKIYLLRHGETTGDVEDRYGGDYDDHLTEKGRAQSQELAQKLKDCGVDIIFSSPRIRAHETAEILQRVLDCKLKIVEDIRERNAYGVLTGMVKSKAREDFPDLFEKVKDYHNTIKGAESYDDFKIRISRGWQEIIDSGFDTVAIVTHGGPIRCLFREFLRFGEFKELGDCAFIDLEKDNAGIKIVRLENAVLEQRAVSGIKFFGSAYEKENY